MGYTLFGRARDKRFSDDPANSIGVKESLTLDQFLEKERDAGDLESSGGFTVSLSDALAKMVKYRYPRPHCFALRLLQSVALVGGRNLVIQVKPPITISFTVDEPGRYGDTANLLEAMSRPEHKDSAEGYLAATLQAALSVLPEGFRWTHLRGGRVETVTWDGRSLEVARRYQGVGDPLQSTFTFAEGVQGPEAFSIPARIARAIFIKPRPALIDAAEFVALVASLPLHFKWRHPKVPLTRLGANNAPGVLVLAPRKALDTGFGALHRSPWQSILSQDGRPQSTEPTGSLMRCSSFLTVGAPAGEALIRWVHHGVEISRETVPSPQINFEAWLSAEGLQTDLSGFGIVKNEAYEARIRQATELARNHLEPLIVKWTGEMSKRGPR